LVEEGAPHDLCACRPWQLRGEADAAGHLEPRQTRGAPRDQFDLIGRNAGTRDDPGDTRLPPAVVWHSDHGSIRHGGMREEHTLDLSGRDPLPSRDEDVLDAVDDPVVALRITLDEVARVQPAR